MGLRRGAPAVPFRQFPEVTMHNSLRLEGSCHCGAAHFSLMSETSVPYMRCYCSVCRKTAGGGGYAINIMGLAGTMAVSGQEHLRVYSARLDKSGGTSPARRHFCGLCGSALWISDPRWPEWVYPFASAIDTPLPVPSERVRMMENHAPDWCAAGAAREDTHFPEYPSESIHDWHERQGLLEKG